MKIPTERTKEAMDIREGIIRSGLGKLRYKSVKCPCLGNVPVYIDPKSIDEIADKAKLSAESTRAALQLRRLIHDARFVRMTLPKENNTQKKKFQLIFMYELQAETLDGKKAKLTVGVRESPLKFLQYCITSSE